MRRALAFAFALAGCYRTNMNPGAGNIRCGDVDGDCPQGYACGCDGTCYLASAAAPLVAAAPAPVAHAVWERVGTPAPRKAAVMVYDRQREVTILYGGSFYATGLGYREFGDTWEWDGTRWHWRTDFGVSPRWWPGISFDETRKITVAFSGLDDNSGNALVGTWEWDGGGWTARSALEPPPRWGGGMAYDVARGGNLLFGGESGSGMYSDVWSWNGTEWTELCATAPCTQLPRPSPRTNSGVTFDRMRSELLVFGGHGTLSSSRFADLWSWNGTAWTKLCTDTTCSVSMPPQRSEAPLVYDEARDRAVFFGGNDGSIGPGLGDTWEWTGTAWVKACSDPACQATQPAARYGHAMAYDAKRARTLMFGGDNVGDLWEWDGTQWMIRQSGGPAPQRDHALAFDSARARTVLFDVSARTWEWDGSHWADACTGTCATVLPEIRRSGAMTFDAAHGTTVLFGGKDASSTAVQSTWAWDGAAWTQLCTTAPCNTTLPAARTHHAMAFDSLHGVAVLFGGTTSSGANAETWAWDGTGWADACTSSTCLAALPAARQDHAMAFDAKRGVLVMFGGTDGTGMPLGDTWEWNGESWSPRCTSAPCNVSVPPARSGHVLAYDARRGRVVLFGGKDSTGARDDLWEWDGTAWIQIASEGPVARLAGAATYDSTRGRIVLFGGDDTIYGPLADTWEYHLRGEACADGTTCDSGSCVDGVCCEVAACDTCASCSIGDDAGTCVPITDMPDDDSCSGTKTCSSTATCALANGQPCTTDDECASTRCGADPCNRVCI